MWILIIFTSIIFYALAETLQKLGVNIKEEHCEIKLLIWFGIASGATSLGLQLLGLRETTLTAFEIVAKQPLMVLSPLLYYLSLFFCFVGFKLIPVSVASPITCMDGVFTFVGVIVMSLLLNRAGEISGLKLALLLPVLAGTFACTVLQSRAEDKDDNRVLASGRTWLKNGSFAVIGVVMTAFSALLDAGSSLTDLYFFGEISESYDYIYAHGILVLIASVILYIALCIMQRHPYRMWNRSELPKALGAGLDCFGEIFYMIAAARNQIYTNVLISGFCAFTVLFSRMILKERIGKKLKIAVAFTIVFIVFFSVADELL